MRAIWKMGATELSERIRKREISSVEVVRSHLARIESVNPQLNAVTSVLSEEALLAAASADAALGKGEKPGPLSGVPFSVKENIDVKGSATTLGVAPFANNIASDDSVLVRQLRVAGGIPLARTNMPEFGMRWHTDNALRGATRNPWLATLTPGGSSGGEGVALATGMSPLGLGNDGAGSLRWPAQCSGIAALKPSLGRLSQASWARPRLPVPFAFQLLAVHGPMAREVRDLRLAFSTMIGEGGSDPWHVSSPLTGPEFAKPVRVSLVAEIPGVSFDQSVVASLRKAANCLRDAGYVVEEREMPGFERGAELYRQLMSAYSRVQETVPDVPGLVSDDMSRFWAGFEGAWGRAAGKHAFDPMMERGEIARAWWDAMHDAPLVLAPISARNPFHVGDDLEPDWMAEWPANLRAIVIPNLLGLPAVAVPTGVDESIPQAVQVIGPRFREDLCLDAAEAIEERLGRFTPIEPR